MKKPPEAVCFYLVEPTVTPSQAHFRAMSVLLFSAVTWSAEVLLALTLQNIVVVHCVLLIVSDEQEVAMTLDVLVRHMNEKVGEKLFLVPIFVTWFIQLGDRNHTSNFSREHLTIIS